MTKLPAGFLASGVAAGLKPSGKPDVGLLVSETPATAVGVFTANRFQAAPVIVTKRHLRTGKVRAVAVNAGNANACTGSGGIEDAGRMAALAAGLLGVRDREVLVASTGIIGRRMDMGRLTVGLGAAASGLAGDIDPLACAIMTTDTRPKIAEADCSAGRLLGVAKGAGMIAPEMATMLCFIVTEAVVSRGLLADALQRSAAGSFNMISVDGCMSTNDTVLLLANGARGGDELTADHPAAADFRAALDTVCASLARQIVEDGEGATKVVAVTVEGAANAREAKTAARSVADSVLLRCAVGGADPNWGRVLSALGTSGIPLDPHAVDVWMGGQKVVERGATGPGSLDLARTALQERNVEILIQMDRGAGRATLYTNDLTAEYVRINGEYTT